MQSVVISNVIIVKVTASFPAMFRVIMTEDQRGKKSVNKITMIRLIVDHLAPKRIIFLESGACTVKLFTGAPTRARV